MGDYPEKDLASHDTSDLSNETQYCTICFESYTSVGEQRPACLPCGHLFCLRCIEVWHAEHSGRTSLCPTCKRRFRKREIRTHYVQGIKAIDNSDVVNARQTIMTYKERVKRAEMDLANANYEVAQQRAECAMLQNRVQQLESKLQKAYARELLSSSQQPANQTSEGPHAQFKGATQIDDYNDFRVMALNPEKATMLISCRFQTFFTCHSVAKIDMHTMRPAGSAFLHALRIRDMQFCPTGDSTFMSCSLDKHLKVHNSDDFQPIASIFLKNPVWSCCYDSDEPHRVFAGTANGKVKLYDLRMVRCCDEYDLPVVEVCSMGKPILSLRWSKFQSDTGIPSGLMVTSTSDCSFYSKSGDAGELTPHMLPLQGRITSFSLDESSGHFLVSMGPSSRVPTCQHLVFCNLNRRDEEDITAEDLYELCVIRRFGSSAQQTVLSRNCLFPYADRSSLSTASTAAVYDEFSHQIELWNMNTNERTYWHRMPGDPDDPNHLIYDLATYNRSDGRQLLFALSKHSMYSFELN